MRVGKNLGVSNENGVFSEFGTAKINFNKDLHRILQRTKKVYNARGLVTDFSNMVNRQLEIIKPHDWQGQTDGLDIPEAVKVFNLIGSSSTPSLASKEKVLNKVSSMIIGLGIVVVALNLFPEEYELIYTIGNYLFLTQFIMFIPSTLVYLYLARQKKKVSEVCANMARSMRVNVVLVILEMADRPNIKVGTWEWNLYQDIASVGEDSE